MAFIGKRVYPCDPSHLRPRFSISSPISKPKQGRSQCSWSQADYWFLVMFYTERKHNMTGALINLHACLCSCMAYALHPHTNLVTRTICKSKIKSSTRRRRERPESEEGKKNRFWVWSPNLRERMETRSKFFGYSNP